MAKGQFSQAFARDLAVAEDCSNASLRGQVQCDSMLERSNDRSEIAMTAAWQTTGNDCGDRGEDLTQGFAHGGSTTPCFGSWNPRPAWQVVA